MNAVVNGNPVALGDGSTVADVVALLAGGHDGRGVAVAVNGSVVPRTGWPGTGVTEGDRIEVLVATQGG